MKAHPTRAPLPPRVQAYLNAVVRTCPEGETPLVSVILFGSAATGGFSHTVSDVDLILVLPPGATREDRRRLRDRIVGLETLHGMHEGTGRQPRALESLFERITATDRSFFVCTRPDLLSGHAARILDLRPAQAFFVDRVVVPSIVASAVTVWGEELLASISLPPIRRLDVFKSLFGLFSQVLTSAALFPLLPDATRYAMGALKRSVHNCFFCYHGRPAPLHEEVAFFQKRLGPSRALEHEDEQYKGELHIYLGGMRNQGLIDVWQDRLILAGAEFDKDIARALEESDIIVLLVTAPFLDSKYCWGIEMTRAVQRHDEGTAKVVPIILKPTPSWRETPFGKLIALPKDGKPVTTWENRDLAWTEVAEELRRLVVSMQSGNRSGRPQ